MKAKMNNWRAWIKETDEQKLEGYFRPLLLASGFKIVGECEHAFEPQGWTKIYLLAESHFAIHTFPEEDSTYIELSSCVDRQFESFMAGVAERGDFYEKE